VAVTLAVSDLGARDQSAQQTPQFRGGVDLVQIDVSVLDRDRLPVRGLTVDDFTLLEDGEPQTITNFAFIDTPTREWTESVWPDDVVSNVPSGQVGDGRLMVLLMDDANTFDPRARGTSVATGRAIIAQMGPQDLAAVVFTSNARSEQDFTNDRARLLAAVDGFTYRIGSNPMMRIVQLTQDLADVPDRRKLIFYIGPGYNFNASLLGPAQDTYGDVQGQMSQLVLMMQDVFRTARLANVAVYSFDPLGLGPVTGGLAIDRRQNQKDFLRIVSGETGGRAVVNLNEPAREVPRVFRENSSYYLLGFQSTNEEIDGKHRKIQVKVDRRSVDVRARSGYFALGPQQLRTSAYGPRARAERGMANLMADPDLPMSLSVVPIAGGRRDDPSLAVAVRFDAPMPRQPTIESVALQLSVFDIDGRPSESAEQDVSLNLRPGPGNRASYQVLWNVEVDPGQYQVAVSAKALERDAEGSVVVSVTVPDFEDEDVSISGLVLEGGPALPSFPDRALAGVMPVMPTTERIFDPSDVVTAFCRIFQGDRRARPIALTTRIVDADGATVFDSSETVAPDRFAASESADYRFVLPLGELTAGPHVLSIEAALDDEKIARSLAFTVR
jgi:VWFA-related protein